MDVEFKYYRMKVYIFGVILLFVCCNYVLQRIVEEYGNDYDFGVFVVIMRNMYVDDCFLLADIEEKVRFLIRNLIIFCK